MNSPPRTNPPVPKGPRRVDLWSADILSALGDVALSGRRADRMSALQIQVSFRTAGLIFQSRGE
jgi:hypothetical protein